MNLSFTIAFVVSAAAVASAEVPTLELVPDAGGGSLVWLGHTKVGFDEPLLPGDHLLHEKESGILSVGLAWNSRPAPDTGECLGARLYWRIPEEKLSSEVYVIAVRRVSETTVTFALTKAGEKDPVLLSPECPLIKMYSVGIHDLSKSSIAIVDPEVLKSIKEAEKNGEPGATDNPDDAQRSREDH